ncbi:MAG: hypothetical protein ACOH2D_11885, partial [Gelidibacter sp.]
QSREAQSREAQSREAQSREAQSREATVNHAQQEQRVRALPEYKAPQNTFRSGERAQRAPSSRAPSSNRRRNKMLRQGHANGLHIIFYKDEKFNRFQSFMVNGGNVLYNQHRLMPTRGFK